MKSDPEQSSSYILSRPLGTSERVYWLYDRAVCTNFSVFAELERPPDMRGLRAALDAMQKRHPSLRARIEVENGRAFFKPVTDLSITVEERTCIGDAWREEVLRQLELSFEPGASPLARCLLFSRTDDGSAVLVCTFCHAAADARSATVMVEEMLASAYAGTGPDSSNRQPCPPQEQLYPKRFRGGRGLLISLWILLLGVLDMIRGRHPVRIPLKSAAIGTKRVLRLHSFQLGKEESAKLRESCKREKVTVGAALGSAQLAASYREIKTGNGAYLGLSHAIDMRSRLEERLSDRDLGMFSSMVPTVTRLEAEKSFWDTAREVKKQLDFRLARGYAHVAWSGFPPDIFFPPNEKGAARLKSLFQKIPPMTVLTNIGDLNGSVRGPVRSIQFTIGPPPGCPLVTSAGSFDGVLSVNCCFDTAIVEEELATRMTAGIKENLLKALQS